MFRSVITVRTFWLIGYCSYCALVLNLLALAKTRGAEGNEKGLEMLRKRNKGEHNKGIISSSYQSDDVSQLLGYSSSSLSEYTDLELEQYSRHNRRKIRRKRSSSSSGGDQTSMMSSTCHVTCTSVKQRPVCASDGRTYSSKCHMRKRNKCDKLRLRVVSKGRCPGETRCQEERRTAVHDLSLRPYNDLYVPECTEEGHFLSTQCHNSTGYCWCVSTDGKPIPGSSVHGRNLTCSINGKAGGSQSMYENGRVIKQRRDWVDVIKGIQRHRMWKNISVDISSWLIRLASKGCNALERSIFNTNLVRLFNEEYVRIPPSSLSSTSLSSSTTIPTFNTVSSYGYIHANASSSIGSSDSKMISVRQRVVEWKFFELDKDSDKLLKRVEIKSLRYMVVKLVRPRPCALNFRSYCDLDNDNNINLEEWIGCLGEGEGRHALTSNESMASDTVLQPSGNEKLSTKKKQNSLDNRPSRGGLRRTERLQPSRILNELPPALKGGRGGGGRGTGRGTDGEKEHEAGPGSSSKHGRGSSGKTRAVSFLTLISQKSAKKSNKALKVKPSLSPPQASPSSDSSLLSSTDQRSSSTADNARSAPSSPADSRPRPESWSPTDRRFLSESRTTPRGLPRSGSRGVSAAGGGGGSTCLEDRARAKELDKADPTARVYIPECEPSGMFRRAQCHNSTGYCFCVDELTGVPIPGISTRNTTPNCSVVKTKRIKGCPLAAKKQFLTDLLDHVTQEMVDQINNGTIVSAGEPDPDQTIEERAVRWKLRTLDTNRNNILEKSELKEFREEMIGGKKEEDKHLRKCRRNFLHFCDENNDSHINLVEWVDCMGLNGEYNV